MGFFGVGDGGLIQFARTKSGKTRAVPITDDLGKAIRAHRKTHKRGNVLFEYCTGAFKEAIERAKIELPLGQLTHVLRHTFADPFQSLSIKSDKPNQLCVVTVFAARACYDADFEVAKRAGARDASFQQTLIYSGRIGNKINIGYREFSNNSARPAFNNDVEYDLSTSNQIGYKGALLEVLKADNSSITYKVINSFK